MINWKIKVQNPAFWITNVLGIFGIVGTYFGVSGADMTTWKAVTDTLGAAIACPYVLGMIAWFVLSQFFDFGTGGWKDSLITRSKIALSQTAEDIVASNLVKEPIVEDEITPVAIKEPEVVSPVETIVEPITPVV